MRVDNLLIEARVGNTQYNAKCKGHAEDKYAVTGR